MHLSRFWEACHHVSPAAGVPAADDSIRRGAPSADELAVQEG
jgi:hypothetical protein